MSNNNSLLTLYKDRSEYANYRGSEMWKLATFFTTMIVAMITIPIALSGADLVEEPKLLSFFPLIGIVLSLSGIIVLTHQSRSFYKAVYAMSTIRKALVNDFKVLFKNQGIDLKNDKLVTDEFKKIGIYNIDFTRYPTVEGYLCANVFRWKPFSIRIVIYILYLMFIAINFILIYLLLSS